MMPALTRRGRAREGVAAREDAGRPLAEARQPARAARLPVHAARQVAAVHGHRARATRRVEPRPLAAWHLLEDPSRAAMRDYLTRLGARVPRALRRCGARRRPSRLRVDRRGGRAASVLSYVRWTDHAHVVVVLNLTPTPRETTVSACRRRRRTCACSVPTTLAGAGAAIRWTSVWRRTTCRIMVADTRCSCRCRRSRRSCLPRSAWCRARSCRDLVAAVLMSEPSVSTDRPTLHRLAVLLGIAESYVDQSGGEQRVTTDATRERLLAAMGIDASTEERALHALRALRRQLRGQWIAPVRVVRQPSRTLRRVRIRVPTLHVHEVHWTLSCARRTASPPSGGARCTAGRRAGSTSSCRSCHRSAITISRSSWRPEASGTARRSG